MSNAQAICAVNSYYDSFAMTVCVKRQNDILVVQRNVFVSTVFIEKIDYYQIETESTRKDESQ